MSGSLVLNDCYEILTPNGFKKFAGIKQSFKQTLKIKFNVGNDFICTLDHLLKINGKFKEACTIKPNDNIQGLIVVSIELNKTEYVYDPINVNEIHEYYSNELISHNCSFIGSSSTLIRGDVIAALASKKPIFDNKDGFVAFEPAVKKTEKQEAHTYVMTIDTAKGVGGDSSTFSIVDVSVKPYRMVARYKNNKISPLLFPSVIQRWAKEYNNAWCLFEINSSEQVPTIMFYDYEYENMIMVARDKKNGQVVSAKRSAQLGLNMDKKVKRIGCQNLKTLVEERHLDICDVDTIQELSVFIEHNDSYQADDGYHDDLAMSLVIFAWFSTTMFFQDLLDVNMRNRIYQQRMEEIESEELPLGLFVDGTESPEAEVFVF